MVEKTNSTNTPDAVKSLDMKSEDGSWLQTHQPMHQKGSNKKFVYSKSKYVG